MENQDKHPAYDISMETAVNDTLESIKRRHNRINFILVQSIFQGFYKVKVSQRLN